MVTSQAMASDQLNSRCLRFMQRRRLRRRCMTLYPLADAGPDRSDADPIARPIPATPRQLNPRIYLGLEEVHAWTAEASFAQPMSSLLECAQIDKGEVASRERVVVRPTCTDAPYHDL
jgi:hypothetical protein